MKLKLRRVSTMPNQFKSYAYAIVDATEEELKPFSGVYNTANGPIIYSPVRIGDTNVEFTTDITERKVGDKVFINLTDKRADAAGQFAAIFSMAERAGFASKEVFSEKFLNTVLGNQPVNQTNQAKNTGEKKPVPASNVKGD